MSFLVLLSYISWETAISILHNTTRTATVTALDDMVVLTVNGADFMAFQEALPAEISSIITQDERKRIYTIVKHFPLFEGVPEDELGALASLFCFQTFAPNEIIIK